MRAKFLIAIIFSFHLFSESANAQVYAGGGVYMGARACPEYSPYSARVNKDQAIIDQLRWEVSNFEEACEQNDDLLEDLADDLAEMTPYAGEALEKMVELTNAGSITCRRSGGGDGSEGQGEGNRGRRGSSIEPIRGIYDLIAYAFGSTANAQGAPAPDLPPDLNIRKGDVTQSMTLFVNESDCNDQNGIYAVYCRGKSPNSDGLYEIRYPRRIENLVGTVDQYDRLPGFSCRPQPGTTSSVKCDVDPPVSTCESNLGAGGAIIRSCCPMYLAQNGMDAARADENAALCVEYAGPSGEPSVAVGDTDVVILNVVNITINNNGTGTASVPVQPTQGPTPVGVEGEETYGGDLYCVANLEGRYTRRGKIDAMCASLREHSQSRRGGGEYSFRIDVCRDIIGDYLEIYADQRTCQAELDEMEDELRKLERDARRERVRVARENRGGDGYGEPDRRGPGWGQTLVALGIDALGMYFNHKSHAKAAEYAASIQEDYYPTPFAGYGFPYATASLYGATYGGAGRGGFGCAGSMYPGGPHGMGVPYGQGMSPYGPYGGAFGPYGGGWPGGGGNPYMHGGAMMPGMWPGGPGMGMGMWPGAGLGIGGGIYGGLGGPFGGMGGPFGGMGGPFGGMGGPFGGGFGGGPFSGGIGGGIGGAGGLCFAPPCPFAGPFGGGGFGGGPFGGGMGGGLGVGLQAQQLQMQMEYMQRQMQLQMQMQQQQMAKYRTYIALQSELQVIMQRLQMLQMGGGYGGFGGGIGGGFGAGIYGGFGGSIFGGFGGGSGGAIGPAGSGGPGSRRRGAN